MALTLEVTGLDCARSPALDLLGFPCVRGLQSSSQVWARTGGCWPYICLTSHSLATSLSSAMCLAFCVIPSWGIRISRLGPSQAEVGTILDFHPIHPCTYRLCACLGLLPLRCHRLSLPMTSCMCRYVVCLPWAMTLMVTVDSKLCLGHLSAAPP